MTLPLLLSHHCAFLKKKIVYFALLVLAILISIVCFDNFRMPFIWLSLIWFIVAVFGVLFTDKSLFKVILLNIGVMIGTFCIYESYLLLKSDRERNLRYDHAYTLRHGRPLGYLPPDDTTLTDTAYWKDEQIYHVTYTLNAHGLRVVPLPNGHHPPADSMIFFGGSMAFGQGVQDNETLPFFVGKLSGGKYHPSNFAFIGYGAHQMLAILEHKLETHILEQSPKFGIYVAIIDHINRARGRAFWDQYGPRYSLEQNGQVRLSGYFDQHFVMKLKNKLREKSLIFRKIFYEAITDDDINLTLGIIEKAKTIFESRYPGATFHIILWDRKEWGWGRVSERLQDGLRSRNLRVHPIRNILPEFDKKIHEYTLHQYEPHPNPFTHKLIAKYIINNIIDK